MAAFWAVANNLLEIRSDAFKLCCSYQRPMARRVKDTGAWQRAFQALCTLSVITNCGFLYLSPAMRAVAPDASPAEWMMVFVFLEHVLLALRQVLHYAIPDKPEWVRLALARQQFQSKQALKKQNLIFFKLMYFFVHSHKTSLDNCTVLSGPVHCFQSDRIFWMVLYCRFRCELVRGRDVHMYDTRGGDSYRMQHHRTLASEQLPSQAGVRLINNLPESIKNVNNPNLFKARLKDLLVSEVFYCVDEFMLRRWDH
ncbi:hypothetical protein J6590_071448 [Homalodisca vitripennis]|nr:hypothetical protein J6590_071448 [Homalodisca vitripennis]